MLQYWYYQYCNIYNTGISSIVNIIILVIPVSRPAASYYPHILLIISDLEGKTFCIGEQVYHLTLPLIEILGIYLDAVVTMFRLLPIY